MPLSRQQAGSSAATEAVACDKHYIEYGEQVAVCKIQCAVTSTWEEADLAVVDCRQGTTRSGCKEIGMPWTCRVWPRYSSLGRG